MKTRQLLLILLAVLILPLTSMNDVLQASEANVNQKNGDVNGDGSIDVADIASVISVMAGSAGESLSLRADVNGDGMVDVADIASVISIMAGNVDAHQDSGYYQIPSEYLNGWDEGVVTVSDCYFVMKRDDGGQGYVGYMNDKENSTLGLAVYFDDGFNVTEVVSEQGALRIDENYIYNIDASGNLVSFDELNEEKTTRRNVKRADSFLTQIGEAIPGLNNLVSWIGRYNTAREFFAGNWEKFMNGLGTDLAGTLVGSSIGGVPGAIIGLGIGESFNTLNNRRNQLDEASVNNLLGSSQVQITKIERTGLYSYNITLSLSGLSTRPTGQHWYNKQVDVMTGVYIREHYSTVTHAYKTSQSNLIPVNSDGSLTVSITINNPHETYYVAPVLIPYSGSYPLTGCIRYGAARILDVGIASIQSAKGEKCIYNGIYNGDLVGYDVEASIEASIISVNEFSSWGVELYAQTPYSDYLEVQVLIAPLAVGSCTLKYKDILSEEYFHKTSRKFKLRAVPFAIRKIDNDKFEGEAYDFEIKAGEWTSCPDENHPHMIDLGLPSGTQWACCNVGASTPEGYGEYYAWGETWTKEKYLPSWYEYCYIYSYDYIGAPHYRYDDIGSDIAGTYYDAATANWGNPWHMPTKAQCDELRTSCSSVWTTQNGVKGRKFTGPNGGSVSLPAAGDVWSGQLYYVGSWGDYWSSTPYDESYACSLYFHSGYADWDSWNGRYNGRSVRPVR